MVCLSVLCPVASCCISGGAPSFVRGSGEFHHLGHGDEEHVKTPKLVNKLAGEKIVQLAVGSQHTLALAEGGNLYGWGKNGETDETVPLPKLLPDASKQGVVYIACGAHEVSQRAVCTYVCHRVKSGPSSLMT